MFKRNAREQKISFTLNSNLFDLPFGKKEYIATTVNNLRNEILENKEKVNILFARSSFGKSALINTFRYCLNPKKFDPFKLCSDWHIGRKRNKTHSYRKSYWFHKHLWSPSISKLAYERDMKNHQLLSELKLNEDILLDIEKQIHFVILLWKTQLDGQISLKILALICWFYLEKEIKKYSREIDKEDRRHNRKWQYYSNFHFYLFP